MRVLFGDGVLGLFFRDASTRNASQNAERGAAGNADVLLPSRRRDLNMRLRLATRFLRQQHHQQLHFTSQKQSVLIGAQT